MVDPPARFVVQWRRRTLFPVRRQQLSRDTLSQDEFSINADQLSVRANPLHVRATMGIDHDLLREALEIDADGSSERADGEEPPG